MTERWTNNPVAGWQYLDNDHGRFTVQRHGDGRKYWGVTYPDGTYTHDALSQGAAKAQAESWEPDASLVPLLEVGQDTLTPSSIIARIAEKAPDWKSPYKGYYSYNSIGKDQARALSVVVALVEFRSAIEDAIRAQIEVARTKTGSGWNQNVATWEQVGWALGVTKQSAAGKYGPKST